MPGFNLGFENQGGFYTKASMLLKFSLLCPYKNIPPLLLKLREDLAKQWGNPLPRINLECISVHENRFYLLVQTVGLIKCCIMQHFIWVLTVCQSTCLLVSSIQIVNPFPASHDNCPLLSNLLIYFDSLYCKQPILQTIWTQIRLLP